MWNSLTGPYNFSGTGNPMGGGFGAFEPMTGGNAMPSVTGEKSIAELLGMTGGSKYGSGYAMAGMQAPPLPSAQGQLGGLMNLAGRHQIQPWQPDVGGPLQMPSNLQQLLQRGLMG